MKLPVLQWKQLALSPLLVVAQAVAHVVLVLVPVSVLWRQFSAGDHRHIAQCASTPARAGTIETRRQPFARVGVVPAEWSPAMNEMQRTFPFLTLTIFPVELVANALLICTNTSCPIFARSISSLSNCAVKEPGDTAGGITACRSFV